MAVYTGETAAECMKRFYLTATQDIRFPVTRRNCVTHQTVTRQGKRFYRIKYKNLAYL